MNKFVPHIWRCILSLNVSHKSLPALQIRTHAVSCKQMTMVTPLQLLLFGSRSVTWDEGQVVLDKWYVMIILGQVTWLWKTSPSVFSARFFCYFFLFGLFFFWFSIALQVTCCVENFGKSVILSGYVFLDRPIISLSDLGVKFHEVSYSLKLKLWQILLVVALCFSLLSPSLADIQIF